jgi:hypothetical protein
VAGGYWGSPPAAGGVADQLTASSCLSRASSQSSGFESASGVLFIFFPLFSLKQSGILLAIRSVPDPGSGAFLTPGSGAFLTPGSGMGKKSTSGSGMNNQDHVSESLETIFWLKYLNSLM